MLWPLFPYLIGCLFLPILHHFSGRYRPWVEDLTKINWTLFTLHIPLIVLPSAAIVMLFILANDRDSSIKAEIARDYKLSITFLDNVIANSFVLNLIAYLWLGAGCLLLLVWVFIKFIKMSQRKLT